MRPLRVLSISTLFPSPDRPGFGKFVAEQMRAVGARGDVDLTMVNPIGLPPWPLSLLGSYRAVSATPVTSEYTGLAVRHPRFRLVPRLGAQRNPARIAAAILPMARELHEREPFDLVDAQFFFPDGPAAALIAGKLGLPFTIKARGSDIHYWSTQPLALEQMRAAADGASGMLAVSEALRRDMAALGMDGERIAVHYTGLDRGRFRVIDRAQARLELGAGLPVTGPLLVTPGALIAIKGQRFAIDSLKHLPSAHLALAGAGHDEADLRAHVRSAGLADRVHFLRQVSHDALPRWLAAADAVVLPSEREGLANAWIEALACGTPVVIPDIGGAREVVTGRTAGRIAGRDAIAIADAVRALLADPPSQAEVARHAARFSWDENAGQLAEFWRQAAKPA